jgi:NADH dehydrogenase [ubiquinone] 1 alpha subcomplex assembly factor 5
MHGMDSMLVFDRLAVRRHRDRAASAVGAVADVLRDAAERQVIDGMER